MYNSNLTRVPKTTVPSILFEVLDGFLILFATSGEGASEVFVDGILYVKYLSSLTKVEFPELTDLIFPIEIFQFEPVCKSDLGPKSWEISEIHGIQPSHAGLQTKPPQITIMHMRNITDEIINIISQNPFNGLRFRNCGLHIFSKYYLLPASSKIEKS